MALIKRFLAGYSENFLVAVALWPFASAALTLPILAYLYHRDGRLKLVSVVSTYLAVLYILGLGCFTLYPLPQGESGPGITYGIPWQLNPLAPIGDIARDGISALPQIAFNVVFFIPLGFIAGRLLRWSLPKSVVVGLAASFFIEAAQGTGLFGIYRYAYRTADVDDLIYNTCGAAIGWLISAALGRVVAPGELAREGEVTHSPGFIRRCVAFWLDMTLVGIASNTLGSLGTLALGNIGGLDEYVPHVWFGALALTFVVVEGVAPWLRGGSTPGGGFVRMSCETKPRQGAHRLVFHVVRTCMLGASCLFFSLAWPALALFYLVCRRMPYDLI